MRLPEDRAKAISRIAAEEVAQQVEDHLDAHPMRYRNATGDAPDRVQEEAERVVYDMLRGFEL